MIRMMNFYSAPGYYLATAGEDCCVKLWDLRKLRNFKTLQLDEGYEVIISKDHNSLGGQPTSPEVNTIVIDSPVNNI